jgi:putative ABC transport system permease protein
LFRLLPLVAKNAGRNLRRTLFTTGGLSVSLFLFTALLTVVSSLDAMLEATGKNPIVMVTHRSGWAHVMPESHNARILRVPGVQRASRYLFYGGSYGEVRGPQDTFPSMGVDGEDLRLVWGDQLVVSDADYTRWTKERTGAIVGSHLLAKYGWKPGQRITLTGTAWPVDLSFVIVGEANFGSDKGTFIFHREYLEAALKNPGYVSLFAVQVPSAADIPEVARKISTELASTSDPVRAVSQRSFFEGFIGMMGNVRGLVTGVASLVLIAVLLLVANSVAMSTRERTIELSVLKAIGFQRRHVIGLVVGEAILIALLSGAIGCGVAYALFGGKGFAIGVGPLSGFSVTPRVLAYGVVAAILVAVLASAVPALRIVRLRVTDGLRQVV